MKPQSASTPHVPPAGFEEVFQQETRILLGQRFRLSFGIGIVLYLGFAGLDFLLAPDEWTVFLVMRIVVATVAGLAIYLSTTKWGEQAVLGLSFATLSVASLVLSGMTAMLDGFSSNYFYGNMLVMFLVGLFMPWRPGVTLTFCLLVACGYFIVNLWSHPLELAAVLPFFFLLGTCVLTFLGSVAIEKSRRKDLMQRMELEAARAELEKLDETKTAFFANVSHELRTPLMLILGPLEQLLSGAREPSREIFEAMDTSARRLFGQISQILDFAKIENENVTLSLSRGNLGALLSEICTAAEYTAERDSIRLETLGLDELPYSVFDRQRVETIITNLLNNAFKFTGEGGRITVRAGSNEDQLWFEVEDTGVGIDPQELSRIFDRFHQVSNSTQGKVQGTGLGLSLAREFAQMHGGNIFVKSTPKVGTTFRVELPIEMEGVVDIEGLPDASDRPKTTMRSMAFSDLARPREEDEPELETVAPDDAPLILVVEDNAEVRQLLRSSLGGDFRIETARDGLEGIEKAERLHPDLIVSDVMMPKLDGVNMLRQLRERPTMRSIPVILVTARTGSDEVVSGLKEGAVDYVTKPFRFEELKARIESQLEMVRLLRALDERETRLAAVGQMTGELAHDLRNPLTAIALRAESLRHVAASGSAADLDDDLGSIRESVKKASALISDMLAFQRGEELPLSLQDCSLEEFFLCLAQNCDALRKGARADLVVEVDPPDLNVKLDRDRMDRVLFNLLKNAFEALAKNGRESGNRVWIQAFCEGQSVVLRVADNGEGIPEAQRAGIFQAFQSSGKRGGTGLGLAIVHNLVAAHGGAIELEDRPPEGGAAFRITLKRDQSFWEELAADLDP